MSGDTVASAAESRRQRLSNAETHRHQFFEAVREQFKQIQRLLDDVVQLLM